LPVGTSTFRSVVFGLDNSLGSLTEDSVSRPFISFTLIIVLISSVVGETDPWIAILVNSDRDNISIISDKVPSGSCSNPFVKLAVGANNVN